MAGFIIRIFKAWNSRTIERSWSNTYEVQDSGSSVLDLMLMAGDLVLAERELHLPDVQFLEYTISTWEPDSHPYDPDSFKTVSLTGPGERNGFTAPTLTALDYNVCLMVHRNPVTGRTGRLYYRGVLTEGDVQMGGDARFVITPAVGTGLADDFPNAYLPHIAPYLGVGAEEPKLAMISMIPPLQVFRSIESLTIGGVVVNKKNHKYFDRA